jgi:erythromycin esterase
VPACLLTIVLATPATAQAPPPLLEHGRPVRRMLAPGDIHSFRVALDSGAALHLVVEQRGVDVLVATFAPDGAALSEVDNFHDGPEPVTVVGTTRGEHRIDVRSLEGAEAPAGEYEARIEDVLTPARYASEQAASSARRDSAVAWMRRSAIRLNTVEAGNGFADMAPLRDVVGHARVVALGEATHGTREFFQLKHRMLEFLVSEMGFTAFGIEATMPESFDINDYVLSGYGDPAKAIAGLYFWTWHTEEVLALIEWIRRWNADPQHLRKVHFYGFDMQSPSRAAHLVRDYLQRLDPGLLCAEEPWLELLADPFTADQVPILPAVSRDSLATTAAALLARFDERRGDWSARAGDDEWVVARQHARILVQFLANVAESGSLWIDRDQSMADNVRWALDREGPQGRIMLWAHNVHVASGCEGSAPMGCHLRRALGDSLLVAGFDFNRGGFQARGISGALREFTVEPLDSGSLGATLAQAGLSVAALDLRALPVEGPVAEWFSQPVRIRSIGSRFSEAHTAEFVVPLITPEWFDVLLFVDSTSAARAMPGGRRGRTAPAPAPINLGFEDVEAEGHPRGWTVMPFLSDFDFRVTTAGDDVPEGRAAAVVTRVPGHHYGEVHGGLSQTVDATPFRGRRVRLHAMIRADPVGEGSRAYLWLSAARPDEFMSAADGNVRRARAISVSAWAPMEIEVDIPTDAVSVGFGLALVGDGTAGIDAVRLQVVP